MESQPTPNSQDIQSNAPPPSPTPPNNKYRIIFILGGLLLLLLIGVIAYLVFMIQSLRSQQTIAPTPSPYQEPWLTTSPTPSPEATNDSEISLQSYTNVLGYSLNFPSDWELTEVDLATGEAYQVDAQSYPTTTQDTGEEIQTQIGTIDIDPVKSPTSLAILNKSDQWYISIQAQTDLTNDCGSESDDSVGIDPVYDTSLTLLDKTILRPNLEAGELRAVPHFPETAPVPQPIQEYTQVSNQYSTYASMPFCLDFDQVPLRLTIQYHSPLFTVVNFSEAGPYANGLQDPTLDEMDDIITSITLE